MGVARGLLEALAEAGAHRHDLIVSVGGGVVSDLAGFVASVYARGMKVAHVPTTLLGQVDAAIGGKTGVNLPQAKNLVGTIHQPIAVLCDVGALGRLPREEFTSGMAEVVKYGFISDPAILDEVMRDGGAIQGDPRRLSELVARCVRIKAAIVASDENESGIRAHLNYGHTFGHAIERTARFEGIRHGEAVAIGMVAAANLALELGMLGPEMVHKHEEVLRVVGLPTRAPLYVDELEPAWLRDKKYRNGVRFVLLNGPGRPEYGVSATREQISRALERMR
jgi:3-dehydroquinate synthase